MNEPNFNKKRIKVIERNYKCAMHWFPTSEVDIKWHTQVYITADAAKQLVHAFVTSRLDNHNGNSLVGLYGLPLQAI